MIRRVRLWFGSLCSSCLVEIRSGRRCPVGLVASRPGMAGVMNEFTIVIVYLHEGEVTLSERHESIEVAAVMVDEVFRRGFDDGSVIVDPLEVISVSVYHSGEDDDHMSGKWGKRHADADKDARKWTAATKQIRSRGQQVPDKIVQERGEAITRRADAKEAAKNERGRKG